MSNRQDKRVEVEKKSDNVQVVVNRQEKTVVVEKIDNGDTIKGGSSNGGLLGETITRVQTLPFHVR